MNQTLNESRYGDDGELVVYGCRKVVVPRPRLSITGSDQFLKRLEEFVVALQAIMTEHYTTKFPTLEVPVITVQNGQKNVRIVRSNPDGSSRSVHCFIQKDNGDILKAAGWKAPAKHARGNIYKDLLAGVTLYGAEYMK